MKWMIAVLLIFLIGCAPQPEHKVMALGNKNYSDSPVGIYLVPAWGVDSQIIRYLENTLSAQHKTRVKVTTDMGLDEKHFDDEHQQFVGEEIYKSAKLIATSLSPDAEIPPIIVIIPGDMNSKEFRFRFLFSQHFMDGISVVSLARINPASYGQKANVNLTSDRALKLVNKALGYHMYDYQPSSDINNVMYGPIMSVHDLDKVNSWYR